MYRFSRMLESTMKRHTFLFNSDVLNQLPAFHCRYDANVANRKEKLTVCRFASCRVILVKDANAKHRTGLHVKGKTILWCLVVFCVCELLILINYLLYVKNKVIQMIHNNIKVVKMHFF